MLQKPFDNNGLALDSLYSIELRSGGFDLLIESRSGADAGQNVGRNTQYAAALEHHLARMAALGMVLLDVQIASSPALKLPESDRRVALDSFALPLALTSETDVEALRHSIGRASAAFGREDGGNKGNRTKRIQLSIQWPDARALSADGVSQILSHALIEAPCEEPTNDPDLLQRRANKAINHFREPPGPGYQIPPKGNQTPERADSSKTGFIRDPNVIAWVLAEADGICEACKSAAPFLRAGGEPYLEVHHVRPLADGGPDTVDNAIACCPNCHRRLHHAQNRDEEREKLFILIERLRDYPSLAENGNDPESASPKT
jgi:hypothetical protein